MNIRMFKTYSVVFVLFLSTISNVFSQLIQEEDNVYTKELKCLVCKRVVEEMIKDIDSVDPKKKVEVGSYRFDGKEDDGSHKKVELRRSEMYLTEMMERICNKMDDYVRARMKKTGELLVIPLTVDGFMNPIVGEADLIQDPDLNKGVKYYCERVIEENEEHFTKLFAENADHLEVRLCSLLSGLCHDKLPEKDYEFEAHEDL